MTDDAGTERTGGEDRSRAGRREQMQRLDALEQRVDDMARALDGLEGLLQQLLLTASTPAAPTDPPAAAPDTADPHTAAPHTADPDAAAPPAGRNDQDDQDDPDRPRPTQTAQVAGTTPVVSTCAPWSRGCATTSPC